MMPLDKQPIIVVENLTARFGEAVILDKVSFEVSANEILIILGTSGCGKSTLLKQMIGLYKPYKGRILIQGVDINTEDENELQGLRMNIGVSFQGGGLFGSMTVGENIAMPLREYTDLTEEDIQLIVKMKLGLVNLAGYERHLPEELSGGMLKRVALARAMVLDPTILFFDEPTAGLDPVTAAGLDILLKNINSGMGTTMVVVTHELHSIFAIAHRVIMLDKSVKGIIAFGDPMDLKENSTDLRVQNFFNRRPESKTDEET